MVGHPCSVESPVATYRLQLRKDFTFDDATALVPYLAALGVSHLYLSPILQAAPGSQHGYDTVDHSQLNSELGGMDAFVRLSDAAKDAGLGIVVDIVPNHMCISGSDNAWWRDVLENGPASPWADFFDVDWHPVEEKNRNTVLLPILGDHRGAMIARGEIRVERDVGRFGIRAHDHVVPVAPRTIGALLKDAATRATVDDGNDDAPPLLAFLADCWRQLPPPELSDPKLRRRRHRDKLALAALTTRLLEEDAAIAIAVDAAIAALNADADRLDGFLEAQNHRLAYWKTAARELDYRRFFDVDSLAGLRVEDTRVFTETHQLIGQLVRDGRIQGLRVDHVDGLADPAAYLKRLRELAPLAWIVVEKILGPDEALPSSWPVEGTTGYDFLNHALHVFVDPRGASALTGLHAEFTGSWAPFADVAADKRALAVRDVLASDVERATQALVELSASDRAWRDLSRHELRAAVRAVLVTFCVYRSYVAPEKDAVVDDNDRARITAALTAAQAREPELDPLCFELIRQAWLDGDRSVQALRFITRVQQLTGTAVAKGVEDTAFYAWSRFIALNEVGGEPDVIDRTGAVDVGSAIATFHDRNRAAAQQWPRRMVTTSTHDTKRSEDVRARLCVLSERADWWAATVRRFVDRNLDKHRFGAPDGDLELALYQTMVGAWPLSRKRCLAWAEKAAREAKHRTSWTKPNAPFEGALKDFIVALYQDLVFVADLEAVVADVTVVGRVISLAQLTLKLMSPGVPDLFQGTELWNLNLVDPDNRRLVDFDRRRSLLQHVNDGDAAAAWRRNGAGTAKLLTTQRLLQLRRRRSACFGDTGRYAPLPIDNGNDRAVAFDRDGVVVVVPARAWSLFGGSTGTLLTCNDCGASVQLPAGSWVDVVSGARHEGRVSLSTLWRTFPVAVLERSVAPLKT